MSEAHPRPNILLITSDQQHWDTLGVTNPRVQTPALDRLCAEGTRFERAYCNNPVCSPSRSTIITGMYPSWHGCWTIGVKLPEDVPTVGDVLQEHGYATSLIGKAHFQPLATVEGQESLEYQPLLRDLRFLVTVSWSLVWLSSTSKSPATMPTKRMPDSTMASGWKKRG